MFSGILLTNDDGPPNSSCSPFLLPFISHLLELSTNLFICTPSQQQSFVGHALTRTPTIQAHRISPSEWNIAVPMDKCVQIVTVQGTPATAVNIALEHIRPFPIQLVVSGPNVGQNAGSSFIGCSGTVGAALEATIQGVPAVAISFAYSNPVFDEREVQVACRIAVRVIKEIWEKWSAGEFKRVEMFNVNVPLGAKVDANVFTTFIHHEKSYGNLYKSKKCQGDDDFTLEFEHGDLKFDKNAPPGSDRWAINNKFVSVTPLIGCLQLAPLSESPFQQFQV